MEKIQHVSEIVFEYDELVKLFNEENLRKAEIKDILKQDRIEND